jgi:hypothetical protein
VEVALMKTDPRTRTVRRGLIPVLLGLLLFLPAMAFAQQAQEVEVGDIHDNIGQYYGQTVVVETEVVEVLEPRAFVIGDAGFLGLGVGGNELLVMADHDPALQPEDGAEVRVTGQVGRFNLESFAQAIGGTVQDLQDTPYADWDGDPVLVLQSIEPRHDNNGNGTN